MTISDIFAFVWSEKVERCHPESKGHLQNLRTAPNLFFFQCLLRKLWWCLGTVACCCSGHRVLARSLLQGGVLTSCGFGTKVRINCSGQGTGRVPGVQQTPFPYLCGCSSFNPCWSELRVFMTLLGKFVDCLLFCAGWNTDFWLLSSAHLVLSAFLYYRNSFNMHLLSQWALSYFSVVAVGGLLF